MTPLMPQVSPPEPGGEFTLELVGPPRGMHRPRTRILKGRAVIYTDPADKSAMLDVNRAWLDQGSPRLVGPIAVSILLELARPRGHYRGGHVDEGVLSPTGERSPLPTSKPDLDNAAKLVMDGLNGRAYRDDVDVVVLTVRRRWSEDGWERTLVRVAEVVT